MKSKKLDPFLLPTNRREHLYSQVLLVWETTKSTERKDKFNSKKILATCGVHVIAASSIEHLYSLETEAFAAEFGEEGFICFFNKTGKEYGSGYPCLMKRLRDTVAHGHYTSIAKDWIEIRHAFHDRLHIFGHIAMTKLIALVEFANTSDERLSDD